jgi:hypothetical protein
LLRVYSRQQTSRATHREIQKGPKAVIEVSEVSALAFKGTTGRTALPVVYSDKVDSILSAGVWLGPHHRNWALKREQALTAISCLRDAYCIVLGGDVLNGPDKNYSHTYDNWFFQPSNPPVPGDVPSSALKAIAYVRDYPLDEAYFVLVPLPSMTA